MSRYLKINVGDTAKIKHTITNEDLKKFVELSGDNNRLHIDKQFASRTHFKKPVAPGMIGASFISTIIGTKIPGDGALCYSQSLEFLLPVRIGDKNYWGSLAGISTLLFSMHFAFDKLKLIKFHSGTYSNNLKSRFLLKKLGCKEAEKVQGKFFYKNKPITEVFYSMDRTEWSICKKKYEGKLFNNVFF